MGGVTWQSQNLDWFQTMENTEVKRPCLQSFSPFDTESVSELKLLGGKSFSRSLCFVAFYTWVVPGMLWPVPVEILWIVPGHPLKKNTPEQFKGLRDSSNQIYIPTLSFWHAVSPLSMVVLLMDKIRKTSLHGKQNLMYYGLCINSRLTNPTIARFCPSTVKQSMWLK